MDLGALGYKFAADYTKQLVSNSDEQEQSLLASVATSRHTLCETIDHGWNHSQAFTNHSLQKWQGLSLLMRDRLRDEACLDSVGYL